MYLDSKSHSVVSDSLQPHGLSSPWNSPGQNTGVGHPSFLQGIFPTQRSNPGLPPLQADSLPTELSGNPWRLLSHVQLFATPWTTVHGILQARILEWLAFLFSRGCSQPRDRTPVSHIAGRFFTSWATSWCVTKSILFNLFGIFKKYFQSTIDWICSDPHKEKTSCKKQYLFVSWLIGF